MSVDTVVDDNANSNIEEVPEEGGYSYYSGKKEKNTIRNMQRSIFPDVKKKIHDLNYNCPPARLELIYNPVKDVESSIVEVQFKGSRKAIVKNDLHLKVKCTDQVIIEVENGQDMAVVINCGIHSHDKLLQAYKNEVPKFSLIRLVNEEDHERNKKNNVEIKFILRKTREFVHRHKLDMKITDAEWQWDRQRLTIYFTAPQRIDFRELVKDLARSFRTRIELRQISTREETKRSAESIGGCGLTLCCNSFLDDFGHVTLDHAKTQQLSNNLTKLTGNCGRLKCCLLYEYDTYEEFSQKYPPIDSLVHTVEGSARIIKVDVFKDVVYLHYFEHGKYGTITYEKLKEYIDAGKVKEPDQKYLEVSAKHKIVDDYGQPYEDDIDLGLGDAI